MVYQCAVASAENVGMFVKTAEVKRPKTGYLFVFLVQLGTEPDLFLYLFYHCKGCNVFHYVATRKGKINTIYFVAFKKIFQKVFECYTAKTFGNVRSVFKGVPIVVAFYNKRSAVANVRYIAGKLGFKVAIIAEFQFYLVASVDLIEQCFAVFVYHTARNGYLCRATDGVNTGLKFGFGYAV